MYWRQHMVHVNVTLESGIQHFIPFIFFFFYYSLQNNPSFHQVCGATHNQTMWNVLWYFHHSGWHLKRKYSRFMMVQNCQKEKGKLYTFQLYYKSMEDSCFTYEQWYEDPLRMRSFLGIKSLLTPNNSTYCSCLIAAKWPKFQKS